ncbi:MAG TPA: ribonuclease P protein component [Bacteroidales bacterium]|nr:ribonuclease P protein component [Bacteroidales bacterium]
MDTIRHTFSKEEKLCSVSIIEQLFEEGRIFHHSIFKVVWIFKEGLPAPSQIAFSVPKRCFRSSVKRNLIKRRMRETYRKNKHLLNDELRKSGRQLAFLVVMKSSEIPDYSVTEEAMKGIISRLITIARHPDKC